MRTIALAFTCVMMASAAQAAPKQRVEEALKKLDPSTRLEQVCDLEAMNRIGKGPGKFRPDRAVVGAISQPKVRQNTIDGSGGAFRSRGLWYQFSYSCRTSPDHMKVLAFEYQVGAAIPKESWESYGLWE